MHPAERPIEELLRDCDVERTKRSGPGGQRRNKVETAIVITHQPSGIRTEASERRSQQRNHDIAVFRLRVELALSERTHRDLLVQSERWRGRVKNGKLAINPEHDDFPALLAEALDAIEQCSYDVPTAADVLNVSTSQLIKLLKHDRRALEHVNEERQRRGKHALK